MSRTRHITSIVVAALAALVIIVAASSHLHATDNHQLDQQRPAGLTNPRQYTAMGFEPIAEVLVHDQVESYMCSGVPIADSDWVATAAHCLPLTPKAIQVFFRGRTFSASSWVTHPLFEPGMPAGGNYDVAFVKTNPDIYNVRVGDESPVEIGFAQPGLPMLVLGYQSIDANDQVSRVHKVASERVVVRCDGTTPDHRTDERFSVGCGLQPGSSGGPVLALRDNDYVLVGVISTVNGGSNGITPSSNFAAALAAQPRFVPWSGTAIPVGDAP
jgi:hypothetical protein